MYLYHQEFDKELVNTSFIMVDGTYVDNKGTQIILVGAKIKNKSQIILVVVCNSKVKACYLSIFNYLKSENIICNTTVVVCDFEMAILSAISELGLTHSACYFHYCQALKHQSDVYTKMASCVHQKSMSLPEKFTNMLKYMLFVPFKYREDYITHIC